VAEWFLAFKPAFLIGKLPVIIALMSGDKGWPFFCRMSGFNLGVMKEWRSFIGGWDRLAQFAQRHEVTQPFETSVH
jgi:hypothetical protein